MSKRCTTCRRVFVDTERFCSHDGTALERFRAPDPLLGEVVGEAYRLQRLLGAGGMARVYEAEQLGLERKVAVKVLQAERALDEVSLQRFRREARAVARLSSPHTVALFDVGEHPQIRFYVVMERLEGEALRTLLDRQGPLPLPAALRILDQVARSLAEAHAHGVVHRDVKPENVFLVRTHDYPAFVKVLDFGLAQLLEGEAGQRLTATREVSGTPAYMAPERVSGDPGDARSDVYALGVLLFELLAGAPPFTGASAHEVLQLQLTEPAPPLEEVNPAVEPLPDGVDDLLWRCLAKTPSLRPANAGELLKALRAAIAEAGLQLWPDGDAPPTSVEPALREVSATPSQPAQPAQPVEVTAPKRRWVLPSVTALALSLGVALGASWSPAPALEAPPPPGQVQVSPEPEPKPAPVAAADSEPEPIAATTSKPEPEPAAATASEPEATAAATSEPESPAAGDPEPGATAEPEPEPASSAAPEPKPETKALPHRAARPAAPDSAGAPPRTERIDRMLRLEDEPGGAAP